MQSVPLNCSVSCIKTKQESSAAYFSILLDLIFGFSESLMNIVPIWIIEALNLVCIDSIRFDALLKIISPLSGIRHVIKIIIVIKLTEFSELVVMLAAEDKADLFVRFEVAAYHTAVVKDLLCTSGSLLWVRAEEMQWFDIDGDHLTLFGTLEVRPPRTEDVSSVWEQDTTDIILGILDSFEKLENDLRIGRDAFCCLASEDEEHVLAWFYQLLCLFTTDTTQLHWWENGLVKGISTAVENSNDEASWN